MKRNVGIFMVLSGIGMLLVSIILSSGAHPKAGLLANFGRMVIVVDQGTWVPHDLHGVYPASTPRGHYEGSVESPSKYPISVSVVLILIGAGVLLTKQQIARDA